MNLKKTTEYLTPCHDCFQKFRYLSGWIKKNILIFKEDKD